MNLRVLVLTVLAVTVLPAVAVAQSASAMELDDATRHLASQLRCPVCQGVSIQDSPTELAQEMKGVIRQQLSDGRTPDQVKAFFVERYGEWVLLEPEPRGFNLLVYLLPILGLVLGGGYVVISVRRWTRADAPQDDPACPTASLRDSFREDR
jgi:cytochrome c-type biogenesis protein CcmH